MKCLAFLLLLPAQIEIAPSTEFSRETQVSAVTATVRIVNVTQAAQGTGTIVAKKDGFVYILTANHLVQRASKLEVATFSAGSYPKAKDVYRKAEFVAGTDDVKDLALIRLATTDSALSPVLLCPTIAVPDKGGFDALAVGCGDGQPPTCLIDKVLGAKIIRREPKGKTANCWEVDTAFAQGRSGGPLFDKRGHLLGVLSGTNQGKSYFTHTEEIRTFLKLAGLED